VKQESSQQKEIITQLSQQTSDSGELQKQMAEHLVVIDGLKTQVTGKENLVQELKQTAEGEETKRRSMKVEL